MAKQTMSPSAEQKKAMTAGQIDKAVANYRALVKKHSPKFELEAVQFVLGDPALAREMFVAFRRRVMLESGMVSREVEVDLTLTGQQALDALGGKSGGSVDFDVLDNMPNPYRLGETRQPKQKRRVYLFRLGRFCDDEKINQGYEERSLKAVDPVTLMALNQDWSFSFMYPCYTHWKYAGCWCGCLIQPGDGPIFKVGVPPYVCVQRVKRIRHDVHMWCVGVRK